MPGDMAPAIGPPPDGGVSAWLRVLAYAIICITTLGVQYAFSPLYALLLVELGSPPAETAFVGSLSTGLMDGCGALSGIALERFGYRKTCIMGALMASSGMAIASVCTELWQLYLSYGVLLGIGSSLAFFAPIVIINYWFSRRLSLAHAFANMASATLSLIFGPTATAIFESIGRRNAMLGLAAIMLVLLLSAASLLTTPPPVAVPATTSDAWTAAQAIETRGGSAEAAGVMLPSSCCSGVCTTCAARLKTGSVEQSDAMGVREDLRADGFTLLCVALPCSDLRLLSGQEDALYEAQFGQYQK